MNFLFWFLSAQFLISFAYLLCLSLQVRLSFSAKLRLHYASLASVLMVLILQAFIPTHATFRPIEKYLSQSMARVEAFTTTKSPILLNLNRPLLTEAQTSYPAFPFWSMAAAAFFLFSAILKIKKDLRRLEKIKDESFSIRRIGRVNILAHDQISVPLTYAGVRSATIIVPTALLSSRLDYRMSISHELQHHRQHDPQWMYALEIFKIFGFLNPIAKLWIHKITDLQEFACDETLVDRSRVKIRQYARCLLKAAESALQPEFVPGCATGLIFRKERYQLKRRISMLLTQKNQSEKRSSRTPWLRLAILTLLTSLGAYGSKAIAQAQTDRNYTLADAQSFSLAISDAQGIAVTANDAIVKELNAYLGTPAKRQKMKDALTRLHELYKKDEDLMLDQYDLPKALDAMPIVESLYQNLPQGNSMQAAGLWQFIPSTATKMGLIINAHQDERLDVAKLNTAAGRLLKANALFFNDVTLSILAFNWGDSRVNALITRTHSRDPWTLVKAFPNDTYLPKVIAAMMIVANPKVLE